jgi:transposase InsO family protein
MDVQICLKAISMGRALQEFSLNNLVHHTDRGSQYARNDYRKALSAQNIIDIMSAKVICMIIPLLQVFLKHSNMIHYINSSKHLFAIHTSL